MYMNTSFSKLELFQAIWLLMLLGWVFLPVYIASGVTTIICFTCTCTGKSDFLVKMAIWRSMTSSISACHIIMVALMAGQIYTMPEYLQRRFGGDRLRIYLSIIQMTTYIFATLSVS